MSEPLNLEGLAALKDENTRIVLDYFAKALSASRLKVAYDLKLTPDKVDDALKKLQDAKLIRVQEGSESARMSGQVYSPTPEALSIRKFIMS